MDKEQLFNAIVEVLENEKTGLFAAVDIYQNIFKQYPPEKFQSLLGVVIEATRYVEWRRQAMNYRDRAESMERNAQAVKDLIIGF